MKIMIAVHTYYPEHNGVQHVTQYITEGLAKRHEVLVLTNWYDNLEHEEKYNNVCIERIKTYRNIFHIFRGEKERYIKRVKSYNPDALICVCTQSWPFDWINSELDKLECIKILYTHGYSEYCVENKFWEHLFHGRIGKAFNEVLNRVYYRSAHKYIKKYDLVTYLTETDKSVDYANIHHLTNGKILGNAVDDEYVTPFDMSIKKSTQDGICRFLYVASYAKKKGQDKVLRAFYQADCENAQLIFCGQKRNAFYEKLISMKKELDISYGKKTVEFLYEMPRERILYLYQTSDVFVCGSDIEAFSISLCEAAASALAVITTDVGNARTLPEVLVVLSEDEMAQRMNYLYNNQDEIIRRGMILQQYAYENCRIADKVAWIENEIYRLRDEKRSDKK